jgi:hypothetical protein
MRRPQRPHDRKAGRHAGCSHQWQNPGPIPVAEPHLNWSHDRGKRHWSRSPAMSLWDSTSRPPALSSGFRDPFVLVNQPIQDRSTRDALMVAIRGVGRPWRAKVAGAVGSSAVVVANILGEQVRRCRRPKISIRSGSSACRVTVRQSSSSADTAGESGALGCPHWSGQRRTTG